MLKFLFAGLICLFSLQSLAIDKSGAKCIGGPEGSKGGCFTLPVISPAEHCIMQALEQTGQTSFELSSGEEVTMAQGSGLIAVYDWKSKKQYYYGDNGKYRTEISKNAQCTTESNPKRSLNGLLQDLAKEAMEKARPTFVCKKLGGCGEDKPMLAIAEACKNYLKLNKKGSIGSAQDGEDK